MYHIYHYFFHKWQPNPEAWFIGFIVEGHTGVTLFFVLSGFIFMLIRLNNEKIEYSNFIRNRFLRIFPLFLVIFFVAISIGRNEFRPADILYILFSNLGVAPTSNNFITGAAWTISIEFTFYFTFPFIALAAITKGFWYLPRLIFILLLFKFGAYFVSEFPKHMYYSTLLGRLDQFIIGMMGAMVYSKFKTVNTFKHWYWLLIAIVLCWGGIGIMAHDFSYQSSLQKDPFWIFWPTIEAFLWLSVVVTYLLSSIVLPKSLNQILNLMGQISYSWYLLHALVLFIWLENFGPIQIGIFLLDFTVNVLVVGSISLTLAYLSYHTFEEPFLNMRKKYATKKS